MSYYTYAAPDMTHYDFEDEKQISITYTDANISFSDDQNEIIFPLTLENVKRIHSIFHDAIEILAYAERKKEIKSKKESNG